MKIPKCLTRLATLEVWCGLVLCAVRVGADMRCCRVGGAVWCWRCSAVNNDWWIMGA